MSPIYKVVMAPSGDQYHDNELEIVSAGHSSNEHNVYLIDPIMVYTKCADDSPHFPWTGSTDYPCLLSVSGLTSATATVGEYVIEWRNGSPYGDIILVSGEGSDPDIEVYHPFEYVPVPGGTLYPVIRYVQLDGIYYSSVPTAGMSYSPDLLICLDPVSVKNLTCFNGECPAPGQSHDGYYSTYYDNQFHYSYIGSSPSQATKTVSFVLNTGGTTQYLAWYFKGYLISDTVKFTYINYITHVEQMLAHWRVGTDISTDYTTDPKKYYGQWLRTLCNLTGITYSDGDYVKIEVTPSSNPSTSWDLYTKCMETFDCTNYPEGYDVIDNGSIGMTLVTGSSICYYLVHFDMMSGYTNTTDFFKYLQINNVGGGSSININMYKFTGYTSGGVNFDLTCTIQTGTTSINKTGNVYTLVFQNINDYNDYKSAYNMVTGATNMNNYVSDNTQINYYKAIQILAKSGTTCPTDPGVPDRYIYFHYSSPVNFNDSTKTITITSNSITCGISPGTCNSLYVMTNNIVTSIDTYNSYPDFNWPSTKVRYAGAVYGSYISSTPDIYDDTIKEDYQYSYVHPSVVNNVCDLSDWNIITGGTFNSYGSYVKFHYRVKVVITNNSDPINNWELYNGLDPNGYPLDTWPAMPIYSIP